MTIHSKHAEHAGKPLRKTLVTLSLAVSLVSASSISYASAPAVKPISAAHEISAAEYAQFLELKFGIDIAPASSKGDFIRNVSLALALKADNEAKVAFDDLPVSDPLYGPAAALFEKGIITSSAVNTQKPLDAFTAIFIAVKAAGLKELAYTYPQSKVNTALAKAKLKPGAFSKQAGQEVAAAIDNGLVPSSLFPELSGKKPVSASFVETLLGKVLVFNGSFKHYIGYTSDADIYNKLNDAYNTSRLIQVPDLQQVVDTALKQNLVTGYNLKDLRYESEFIDSLSITYGHDNLTHAKQLIGLLRSEGIDAKVQFEPKTSAYIYLKEWGEPKDTEDYHVVQIENSNYIAYAKEYDLAFEFASAADKQRFQSLIFAYAKKNDDKATGLIASSWWQPLYYSNTELADYDIITNNRITKGNYYAQSFSLNENSEAIVNGFKKLDPALEVETYKFWVDHPFFNYLNGGSN
ncbi:hypothetical protein VN24_23830 [Paenibacillus beijingensis]|uniref:Uncharacterized protein n=2 Tax=Paenibacillus beijingensis TaxID=1126833 RepID=A0A0D5NRS1_9BACL|nr:hypothetical protein VN24_23830 [Paenibacillus beijingensis]